MRIDKNRGTSPLSRERDPNDEWNFVEPNPAAESALEKFWEEAFFYEGCRELRAMGYRNRRVFSFLGKISEGFFPEFPLGSIPAEVRRRMFEAIRDPSNSLHIGARFFSAPLAINDEIQYALTPEFEYKLEQASRQAAMQVSDQYPGSTTEDFLPPHTAAEAARRYALRRILEAGEGVVDRQICVISVTVNFDFSNQHIVDQFKEIIQEERATYGQPVLHETRGRRLSPEEHMRDLAVHRIFRLEGSFPEVENFLEANRVKTSKIFGTTKGWRSAKERAETRLGHLRECLGDPSRI